MTIMPRSAADKNPQLERSRACSIRLAFTPRSRAVTFGVKPQARRSWSDHEADHDDRSRFLLPL